MTSRDRLNAARRAGADDAELRRLEYATACEEARAVADREPLWAWALLVLVACILAAAAVVPVARPAAQIVHSGGEE